MDKQPDIVQVKVGRAPESPAPGATKALQIRVDSNKSVIVYNHINGYILDALMKAVFPHDH
ncbi:MULTISPECIES: hypothetical protein [Lactobacillaceae]|jgi:hypothetical protein|uniref:hypothetical protein n=1 Tax=Lactobacillaceae TaxID=33958 RepID=UPI000EB77888|nr:MULTISPECIES: hypothetical protein [Lactobacillaceae]GEK63688.1 hypothetical protein LJA01_15910 [Lactobacillus japonicus]AYC72660.1 hypothetical protein D5289_11825 [Lactiplantibacillus plantarum]MBP5807539.1 hypothetical protein [Lactiplantibacillus argentoratensis]MBT1143118.1 hypothetical protein [Lactiplantibacillus argentoratensis]MBT1145978.1 hypothetical protein [Lactiplantibacillus argentoratensis]